MTTPIHSRVKLPPCRTSTISTPSAAISGPIEDGTFADIADLFTPDAVMEQLPNRIYPQGVRGNLSRMADAFEQGRKVLSSQIYEIKNALVHYARHILRQSFGRVRDARPLRHVLRIQRRKNRQPASLRLLRTLVSSQRTRAVRLSLQAENPPAMR